MLAVQWPAGCSRLGDAATEVVVAPPESVTIGSFDFPTPSWAQRRCAAFGSIDDAASTNRTMPLARECTAHGVCDHDGRCICDPGYAGVSCHLALAGANYLPRSLVVTSYVVNGLFSLVALGFILWTIRHRHHEVVRNSQVGMLGLEFSTSDPTRHCTPTIPCAH